MPESRRPSWKRRIVLTSPPQTVADILWASSQTIRSRYSGLQFFLNGFVTGQLVEPGDGQRRFVKGVARNGGFKTVIGEDIEAQMEFLERATVLPLFRKTAGADDKTAPEIAAGYKFLDEQAGHDGFARAGVVRKDVAQGQSAQHFLINSGNLMRKRLARAEV